MTINYRLNFLLFVILLFCGCASEVTKSQEYYSINSGESLVSVKLDGKEFYDLGNIFSGEVLVFKEGMRINLFDQFKSNFILTFEEHDLYSNKPLKINIIAENQMAASVMIGKLKRDSSSLSDTLHQQGIGYLMADGIIQVKAFDQDVLLIDFKGQGAKFESFNNQADWIKIEGSMMIKKPEYRWEGITKEEVFYAP